MENKIKLKMNHHIYLVEIIIGVPKEVLKKNKGTYENRDKGQLVLVIFVLKWYIYPDTVIKGIITVPIIINLILKAKSLVHLKKSNYIVEERYQMNVHIIPYIRKERSIDGVKDVTFGLLLM